MWQQLCKYFQQFRSQIAAVKSILRLPSVMRGPSNSVPCLYPVSIPASFQVHSATSGAITGSYTRTQDTFRNTGPAWYSHGTHTQPPHSMNRQQERSLLSLEWRRWVLMTPYLSERRSHNYPLSDMDLSLVLIVCPDAHLLREKSARA